MVSCARNRIYVRRFITCSVRSSASTWPRSRSGNSNSQHANTRVVRHMCPSPFLMSTNPLRWLLTLLLLVPICARSVRAQDDDKTLRVFVVILLALFVADNIFQWDIGALVAGLGIGGLAFALAAKDMLAKFFGSITILADRTFGRGALVARKKLHYP